MTKPRVRLILDNLRSTYNVGSILRTADACNVEQIYACGYTPYPHISDDTRPPHIASSNTKAIAKTALGAELTIPILHYEDTVSAITHAKNSGYHIIVIEQSEKSLNLYRFTPPTKYALVLGNEVEGVSAHIQDLADTILEIPMLGSKESLGVAVAAAVALYQLRFTGTPSA